MFIINTKISIAKSVFSSMLYIKRSKFFFNQVNSKKNFSVNISKDLTVNLPKDDLFLSSFILKKFISQIMKDGKKFKSEKILKKILIRISLKGYSPVKTLVLAINNVKPVVDVRTIRRKGKKFRVPVPLKNSRQITKSIQTLLRVSKNKLHFEEFLVDELINSMLGRSRSLKVTLRLHKFAFQNRSFSNYR